MSDHRPHAAVDCPRCGQRYVDVDIHDYVTAGGTPGQFADMLHRLGQAHHDVCRPRDVPIPPADRRRRAWWWTSKLVVPAMLAITAIARGLAGDPLGAFALGCAIGILTFQPWSETLAYRSGYRRGRITARDPIAPERRLHPADRTWLEERS